VEALAILLEEISYGDGEAVEALSLDHDLGDGPTGYDLLKTVEQYRVPLPLDVRIHSANPVGRESMEAVLARLRQPPPSPPPA